MNNKKLLHMRDWSRNNNAVFSMNPPFPKKNFLLEVTNACNDRCIFCAHSKMTRSVGNINQRLAFRVLQEAYDLGACEVGFYATGEPLLNKDLHKYVKRAKEIGYTYTYLTTNGALLSKERVSELVRAGMDSFKLSINAGCEETYKFIHGRDDFAIVIDNLKHLYQYRKDNNLNYNIFVSFILNKLNRQEENVLVDLIGEYVDDISFVHISNQGGLMPENDEMLQLDGISTPNVNINIKQSKCYMPFNSITVSWEGYLTACCVDFQNYLAVADLNKVSLAEAWNCETMKEIRRKHLMNDLQGCLCANCICGTRQPCKPLVDDYATLFDIDSFDKKAEIESLLNKYHL